MNRPEVELGTMNHEQPLPPEISAGDCPATPDTQEEYRIKAPPAPMAGLTEPLASPAASTGAPAATPDLQPETPSTFTSESDRIRQIPLARLYPHPDIAAMIEPDPTVQRQLAESFRAHGHYEQQFAPLIGEENADGNVTVVEGLTRLAAAREAGLKKLPVMLTTFPDDASRIRYAIKVQVARRRHLTPPDCLRAVDALASMEDSKARDRQEHRGDGGLVSSDTKGGGRANESIGKILGISASTVNRIRCVGKNPQLRAQVLAGKLTIHAAFAQIHAPSGQLASTGSPAGLAMAPGLEALASPVAIAKNRTVSDQIYSVPETVLRFLRDYLPSDARPKLMELINNGDCAPETRSFFTRADGSSLQQPFLNF